MELLVCVRGRSLFSATISHLDYAAVCFVYLLDYETQRFYEKQIVLPIGRNVKMPENVLEGVKFVNDDFRPAHAYSRRNPSICDNPRF